MFDPVLDTILGRTVVAGYTSAGYRIRRGMWNPGDLQPMGGKVVLVTGASSGLGLAAAEGLARLGAGVRLLARSEERGEFARAAIVARSGNSDVHVNLCDLSDLEAVRQFASSFSAETTRLDVLVNKRRRAAERAGGFGRRHRADLCDQRSGPVPADEPVDSAARGERATRIISVSSGGMYTQKIQVEDLQTAREKFDGPAVYARTKRAQVMLTELWARRLQGTGVVVHAMHPGWADTPGVRSSLPRFYKATKLLVRTPEEGADTIVWLGVAPEPGRSSGGFWEDRRQRPTHRLPWTKETPEDRERLWADCERFSGWNDPRTLLSARSNR